MENAMKYLPKLADAEFEIEYGYIFSVAGPGTQSLNSSIY